MQNIKICQNKKRHAKTKKFEGGFDLIFVQNDENNVTCKNEKDAKS